MHAQCRLSERNQGVFFFFSFGLFLLGYTLCVKEPLGGFREALKLHAQVSSQLRVLH